MFKEMIKHIVEEYNLLLNVFLNKEQSGAGIDYVITTYPSTGTSIDKEYFVIYSLREYISSPLRLRLDNFLSDLFGAMNGLLTKENVSCTFIINEPTKENSN